MRTYCPVCRGKGTIDDPKCLGMLILYCGPDAERVPQMTCPNCFGAQFVGVPQLGVDVPVGADYFTTIDTRPKGSTSTTEVTQ